MTRRPTLAVTVGAVLAAGLALGTRAQTSADHFKTAMVRLKPDAAFE